MSSSNPALTVLVAVFALGAALFVIGTLLARERRPLAATVAPAEPELDLATRLDTIERLAIVGQPWCVEQLKELRAKDGDPIVREAAESALIVIGAR